MRILAPGLLQHSLHLGFLLLLPLALRFLLLVLLLSVRLNIALVLMRALLLKTGLVRRTTTAAHLLAIFPLNRGMARVHLTRPNQALVILAPVMRDIQKKTGNAGPQTHALKVNMRRVARAFLINANLMRFG